MASGDIEDVKRSVTIAGHRTSISLERPFWDALKERACSEKTSVNELVRRIDTARGGKGSLSSAIRVYILNALQNSDGRTCAPDN
ncbi:ribbon-helix-helix domain-containing protein [Parvibaculum sp.]|jgi:predicted DNA-binding ribbon-helix-helix protein|uniref:ribbon-helix-helix domain-containing protein n=1 Tax=Parvibaculum sp. TaxID=2024848 RepID=UPI001B15FFA4|nr:ribbon-helix-helix domain-containing protein [Parvibaculum sp.]MBO6636054.1 ribbon-helix-helix domain-containing protein [Parvibaculum sp.]MBO6679767.1 ribbon-helix-helix domain-containing protein [Parvibaculum sp.]MBO6683571.1 ribbon-helix-helix domain-containing protein [Parvibaculum sp.]MBO6903902.1 ribbon-helix-helix domain-containing protein [Parvibaculum sp.]